MESRELKKLAKREEGYELTEIQVRYAAGVLIMLFSGSQGSRP